MKNLSFVGQPAYAVSLEGKVFSLKSNRFLKSFSDTSGYQYVECYKDGKKHRFAVHRLVAMAFIPNPENKKEVNHKDGNKLNNHVDNLEWVTSSENCTHAERSGLRNNATLSDDVAHQICAKICEGYRVCDLVSMFGVSKATISDIKNFKTYKYISCEYEFPSGAKTEKLSDEKVIKICELLQQGKGYKEISKEVNVKTYLISRIKRRLHFQSISNNYCW